MMFQTKCIQEIFSEEISREEKLVKTKVAAVIVTYNRKQLLVECLQALLAQTVELTNITVIDNASTDGTKDLLQEKHLLDNKVIDYVLLSENIGGAGGFYEGLKRLKDKSYDWVWIMDDDTIPQPDALAELLKADKTIVEKTGKEASFLASSIYGEKGEVMNVPELDDHSAENGYHYWYRLLSDGIVNIKTATFVSILVNSKALAKVGLPCRDYFIWGDDSEYTTRLVKYFGPAYMVGKSIAIHKRKNASNLNILKENDAKRIQMYHYMFRNQLVNILYYDGKKAGLKKGLRDLKTSLQGMKNPLRFKIAYQILKGDLEALKKYRTFAKYIDNELD